MKVLIANSVFVLKLYSHGFRFNLRKWFPGPACQYSERFQVNFTHMNVHAGFKGDALLDASHSSELFKNKLNIMYIYVYCNEKTADHGFPTPGP